MASPAVLVAGRGETTCTDATRVPARAEQQEQTLNRTLNAAVARQSKQNQGLIGAGGCGGVLLQVAGV